MAGQTSQAPERSRRLADFPPCFQQGCHGSLGPTLSTHEAADPRGQQSPVQLSPRQPLWLSSHDHKGLIAPASPLPCSLLPLHAFSRLTSGSTQHSFPRTMSPPLGSLTSPGRGHTHFWNPTALSDQPLSFTSLRWFSLRSPQGHGPSGPSLHLKRELLSKSGPAPPFLPPSQDQ